MSIYLPPDQILNNPNFIKVEIKPDNDGGHKFDNVTHYTKVPSNRFPGEEGWEDVIYFKEIVYTDRRMGGRVG